MSPVFVGLIRLTANDISDSSNDRSDIILWCKILLYIMWHHLPYLFSLSFSPLSPLTDYPNIFNNYHFNIEHRDLGSNNSTANSTADFNSFLEQSGLTEVKTKRKLPSTSKSNQIKDEELYQRNQQW